MKNRRDYSDNGENWDSISGKRFSRLAIEIEKGDPFEQVTLLSLEVINQKKNNRFEYSYDGGFSWASFRINQVDPTGKITAAKILDFVNKGHGLIRYLEIEDSGGPYIETLHDARGSIFQKRYQKSDIVKNPSQEFRYGIYYRNGEYNVKPVPVSIITSREKDLVSVLVNTNVFSMSEPNTTRIEWIKNSKNPPPAWRGHIYNFAPASTNGNKIGEMQSVWGAHLYSNDLIIVNCLKNFDAEQLELFKTIPIATILSGKYSVTKVNYGKLGTQWFIRRSDVAEFIDIVNSIGGFVEAIPLTEFYYYSKEKDFAEVIHTNKALEMALRNSPPSEVAELMATSIQYRNELIDRIKELNKSITAAREKLGDHLADEAIARLEKASQHR